MFEGDTGTISFKITGDCELDDTYVFLIKKSLDDATPIFSKTFSAPEFTVEVDEETSQLLKAGNYYWGLKRMKIDESGNEIDTLVGEGVFKIKKGV